VGFFETERAHDTKITRFAFSDYGTDGVHYYIKNVPAEWQPAFQGALDEWNSKLSPIIGRSLLTYEFVPAGDPRNDALVPGDIRYNIIEWDLVNLASYGGLGPSIANQFTGETFSAAILIQGPTIMQLYTDWFKVTDQADHLRAVGRVADAELAMIDFYLKNGANSVVPEAKFGLKLHGIPFKVPSQLPEYSDPLADRNDFEDLPAGVAFGDYMNGYFHDMVAHEMGHNLGLRHNFRGSLADDGSGAEGSVSRSVMEYLNRRYRYLDHIDKYDAMAIAYGYTGKAPDQLNWFCTDEDNVSSDNPTYSAECTKDDATGDPFSFFEQRLAREMDKIVARGTPDAPVWTVDDLVGVLGIAVNGLNSYATSAVATASGWTNFFGKPGRPADAAGVKPYVLEKIKAQLCDPNLEFVIREKNGADAQAKTRANLEAFRAKFAELSKAWGAFTADDLKCGDPQP
jgi:hypothetical protein